MGLLVAGHTLDAWAAEQAHSYLVHSLGLPSGLLNYHWEVLGTQQLLRGGTVGAVICLAVPRRMDRTVVLAQLGPAAFNVVLSG